MARQRTIKEGVFDKVLKKLIERGDFVQEGDFAVRYGVKKNTLSGWKTQAPLWIKSKLINDFGVSPNFLETGEGEMFTAKGGESDRDKEGYKDQIIELQRKLLNVHSIFNLDITIKTSFL